MDAAVALALGEQGAGPTAQASAKPTGREQQVAELIAQGLGNKQIATRLVMSQRTAQGHVEHILTELGFTSRVQIAAWVVDGKPRETEEFPSRECPAADGVDHGRRPSVSRDPSRTGHGSRFQNALLMSPPSTRMVAPLMYSA